MRVRMAPPAAQWLLKRLCSGPKYEPVIGDLTEQYERGRYSPFWYWKQVLSIVFLGYYRETVGRSLVPASRVRLGGVFAWILVIATMTVVLLTDIWMIFLAVIIAGILVGSFKFLHHGDRTDEARFSSPDVARIDSAKIPINGGIGAGVVIAVLLAGVLIELPVLRYMAAPGILGGLLMALALRFWRRSHSPTPPFTKLDL